MNYRELARYQMFKRITGFRDDRPGEFPADTKVGEEFALVEAGIADMDDAEAKHSGGKQKIKGGTTAKAALVTALRLDLRNLARTAWAIADKENTPGFAEGFRLPNSRGVEALLTAGRLFRQNATPVAAKFVAYELPAGFLTHLDETIQAIEAAQQQQNTGLGEQTGGTGAKSVAIRKALNAASQLDTIMKNKYRRDPENLRVWRSANHTERASQREKPAPLSSPTGPPPPPAAAAPAARQDSAPGLSGTVSTGTGSGGGECVPGSCGGGIERGGGNPESSLTRFCEGRHPPGSFLPPRPFASGTPWISFNRSDRGSFVSVEPTTRHYTWQQFCDAVPGGKYVQ